MMLELLKLKASSRWSDTSFSVLLELLTKVLPKSNGLPSSICQAKKIFCPLTLGIEKIHAYPNHCILYQKNTNLKIGVQCAMLVGTNKTITMRRLRMAPTKRAKKGKDERGRMPLPIRTLKVINREKFSLL
jgi:hypothetical protein